MWNKCAAVQNMIWDRPQCYKSWKKNCVRKVRNDEQCGKHSLRQAVQAQIQEGEAEREEFGETPLPNLNLVRAWPLGVLGPTLVLRSGTRIGEVYTMASYLDKSCETLVLYRTRVFTNR